MEKLGHYEGKWDVSGGKKVVECREGKCIVEV